MTTYTVKAGDSLSTIAQNVLGSASLWPSIMAANSDKIKNRDLIYPGWVLNIPNADDPSDSDNSEAMAPDESTATLTQTQSPGMSSTTKTVLISLGLAIVIGVLVFLIWKKKKKS